MATTRYFLPPRREQSIGLPSGTLFADAEGAVTVTTGSADEAALVKLGATQVGTFPLTATLSSGVVKKRGLVIGTGPDSIKINPAFSIWNPPVQPPARIDNAGYFADAFNWDAPKYISDLFDPLVTAAPNYVSKTSLGKDQSGLYDVWKYEFVPMFGYEKTIVLGGAIHGSEVTGMLAIARILWYIVNAPETHPGLQYIRSNVRLVVLPIQNPWGCSQATKTRKNSRGVDINRNADYRWTQYANQSGPGQYNYKGTAPWSESESVIIRDLLTDEKDALLYMDCHNLGTLGSDYTMYIPRRDIFDTSPTRYVIDSIGNGGSEFWGVSETPSPFTWAAATLGMHAFNPEYPDGKYGQVYSSVEITAAVKWFGNLLIQYSRLTKKASTEKAAQPFAKMLSFTSTGGASGMIQVSSTSYVDVPQLGCEIDIPCPGYVKFSGLITVASTVAGNAFFLPKVGQSAVTGNSFYVPEAQQQQDWESFGHVQDTSDHMTLPFCAMIPVTPSGENFSKLKVGGYMKIGVAGTLTVYRYRGIVEFVPTPDPTSFALLSATYRADQGDAAMTQIVPPA